MSKEILLPTEIRTIRKMIEGSSTAEVAAKMQVSINTLTRALAGLTVQSGTAHMIRATLASLVDKGARA